MAEITEKAYEDLRKHIKENWKYVELSDENGDAVLRISTDDERVKWVHEGNERELKLEVSIRGSDSEINGDANFASSSIYNVATGGDFFSRESFSPFTIESEHDELIVVHSILVPQTP